MCDFPNCSLHFLAGLCDVDLQGLASEWASASLWGRDRVEPGDLEDLLRGMRQLARHALFANCGMYLWVSVAGAEEDLSPRLPRVSRGRRPSSRSALAAHLQPDGGAYSRLEH